MSKIIDLDELVGPPKQVRLAGQTYTLPPDLPAELYLKINKHAEAKSDQAVMMADLYDGVLELFRYGNPELEDLPISLNQLMLVIGAVYGDGSGDEADAAPPRKGRAGTPSTSRARKTSRPRR